MSIEYSVDRHCAFRLLRWRLALRWRPAGTAYATLVAHHLVVLLLLVGVEDGLDLAGGLLPDLHHLASAIVLGKRRIFPQGLYLLGFVFENRLDLLLLVSAEI